MSSTPGGHKVVAPAVAIIDPFDPRIIDAIESTVPRSWKLRIARGPSKVEREAALKDADVLFVMATILGPSTLDAASRLRFVQKLGAGVDHIDLSYCAARGIGVARLHAGNSIPVAEHTVLLMLAAYRRLPLLDKETRAGAWKRESARALSRQINGKTIGLVGFGAIGRNVAKLLFGFGVRILYADPVRAPFEVERVWRAEHVPFDALIEQSDIVSLHLPLTNETAGIITARVLATMKPGAVLVNCARGGLVDEVALHRFLANGHLAAAAIDTFAVEPLREGPLLTLEQTILTPHTAGGTIDNFRHVVERAVENTSKYLAGGKLAPEELVVAPHRAASHGSLLAYGEDTWPRAPL
jgi:phosphoglycerate dehydrogenase-like enzyme